MENAKSDSAKPIGEVTIVEDFLPPPEQLVLKKTTVKVTMDMPLDSQKDKRSPTLKDTKINGEQEK